MVGKGNPNLTTTCNTMGFGNKPGILWVFANQVWMGVFPSNNDPLAHNSVSINTIHNIGKTNSHKICTWMVTTPRSIWCPKHINQSNMPIMPTDKGDTTSFPHIQPHRMPTDMDRTSPITGETCTPQWHQPIPTQPLWLWTIHGMSKGNTHTTITQTHPLSDFWDTRAIGLATIFLWPTSNRMAHSCNLMHPTTNSMHYYTKFLTLIWKAVIQVWTICNKHLHPTDQWLADRTQLQNTVNQIFHNIQKDPNVKDLLTYTNPEHIVTKPTHTISQWVDNCHSHICNQAKAAAFRAKIHTHDIHQYFTQSSGPLPQTAAKNLLRPP